MIPYPLHYGAYLRDVPQKHQVDKDFGYVLPDLLQHLSEVVFIVIHSEGGDHAGTAAWEVMWCACDMHVHMWQDH